MYKDPESKNYFTSAGMDQAPRYRQAQEYYMILEDRGRASGAAAAIYAYIYACMPTVKACPEDPRVIDDKRVGERRRDRMEGVKNKEEKK